MSGVNVRNLQKIQDKWLLFQRFVTSIVAMQPFCLVTQRPSPLCETKAMFTPPNICLVCYTATAVFSVVAGGASCDDAKNGCVAD